MSLYKGTTLISGHQVLYSTTGSNTDGAMTQAITTTKLNEKANVDFTNINTTAKILMAHNAMPTTEGQKLLTTAWGTYTAPYDGYAYAGATSTSTVSYVTVNCTTTGLISTCWINASGNGIYAWVPCAKGQSFTVSGYNATLSFIAFKRAIGAIGDT